MPYTETALYVRSVGWTAVASWAASTAYSVGQIVRQLATPTAGNERCFICITAGTSLSSEPTWVLTKGAKTTETGGPVWMECTALPAVNGDIINTNAWHVSAGSIVIGVIIKNVAADHYFICTTAGTGGTGSEPSWNTTTGATTTDSSVTWTCLGAVSSFTARWTAPAKMLLTMLSSNWQVNAAMTLFVGDDSTESSTSNYAAVFACQILSVDHTAAFPLTSSNLKPGATIAVTGGNGVAFWSASSAINGYVYGLTLTGQGNSAVGTAGLGRVYFERCTIGFTITTANLRLQLGDANNTGGFCLFNTCTFTFAAVSQTILITGVVRFENCAFAGSIGVSSASIFSGANTFCNFTAEGCDFSTNVATGACLVGSGAVGQPYGYWLFKDCLIRSDYTAIFRGGDAGMSNLVIDFNRCDSGGANYRNERHSRYGTLTTSAVVARTGGAVDGATPISHQVVTTINALFNFSVFDNLPLVIWNSVIGANRNISIYGISNDSRIPNNDECWFDVEYLGSVSTLQGSYIRGAKVALGTPSALTTDTSYWDSAVAARANSTAYTVGQAIKTASNPGRVFFATTAGTSASSEPSGYASAVDGGSVADGAATFRAGCRFSQTLTLSSPQPQMPGYLYVTPKVGRPSMSYWIDPLIQLS